MQEKLANNGYNYNQIKESIKKVESFNVTVLKKAYHSTVLYQIKALYYDLMSINRWIFNPENEYHYSNYKQSIEFNKTKKDNDLQLHLCLKYLHYQLNMIIIENF